jgi:Tol biopolymer transport system component/DNA-binding winged helix-turn-helix (wHTH) protein
VRDRSVYEFGDVKVDMGRMAAIRGGTAIPLEPKAFDVLVHLIEHRDRVVTRDELLDAVWAGTFVTPNVLSRAVAQIRKALGDESRDARYIETLARRGYRFIAPVSVTVPEALESPAGDIEDRAASDSPPPATAVSQVTRRRPLAWAALALLALSAAAAVIYSMAARPDSTPSDIQLRRLTNRRGYSGMPALSPDGRAVVYASDATGNLELYHVNLLEGSPELPLTNDRGQNIQPAWSPDGQWIAFHSRRRGGVWIVPSTGGVPQQLTDFGSDPAWSPDSMTIVFTSDAGGLAAQSTLWTIGRDGGNRRQLTQVGAPAGGHRAPAWSHAGHHIAFLVTRGGWDQQIWIVDVRTRVPQRVTNSFNAADPCFAPDDGALYWGGSTATGNGRLFRQPIDASGNAIGTSEVVVPLDSNIVEGVSLGANGTLAFTQRWQDANLWAVDIRDGAAGEPVRLTDESTRNTHAEYSRDGRLAYLQIPIGTLPSAWIMRDDGTGRAPLQAGTESFNPQWHPDGTRVLIGRHPPGAAAEFAWIDVASRRMTPAGLPLTDMRSPRLSPDGRELAFHRIEADGRMGVWTSGFDGMRRLVATDPEAVSYPAWSPDGQWLAVEIKRGDTTQIGVVPRAGGAVQQLTSARGQSWPHSWSPDNDRIAFAGEREAIWNVYTISKRSRVITQITSFTAPTGYVRYPAWSPSGSRIVFERAQSSGSVWTATLPQDR